MLSPTDLGYGDLTFDWGDHICAIFDSHAQQMEIMGGFLSAGIQAEQRCIWMAPEESVFALRQRLRDMGGDPMTLEASGQLVVFSDTDYYLKDGVFQPDRTLDLFHTLLADSRREGYAAMRLANDVSWLGGGRVDPEAWEEFEFTVTEEVASLPVVWICQYDRRQVSGAIVVAAMRTHPAVILGDSYRRNPFYEPARSGSPGRRDLL